MSDQTEETPQQQADRFSAILRFAAMLLFMLLIVAAVFGFLTAGWIAGLCLLSIALIFYALGAILDLLKEICTSLKRLESKIDKRADKP